MNKFILGVTIALYLLLVRPYFYGINSTLTLVMEWVTIGMITVAGFLWLRSKLEIVSAPMLLETWTKHKQELNFKSTEELNTLSGHIEEFLNRGKKNHVLLYLSNFLFERKIPTSGVNSALSELINYQDKRAQRIFFSWEASTIHKENVENRSQVLKRIIRNLNENILYFK